MIGLERRARRLADPVERIKTPKTISEALNKALLIHEQLMEAEEDDEYRRLRKKFLRCCQVISTLEKRRYWAERRKARYNDLVAKIGIEAVRRKQAESQRRHRERKKARGLIRIERNGKDLWVKDESGSS